MEKYFGEKIVMQRRKVVLMEKREFVDTGKKA